MKKVIIAVKRTNKGEETLNLDGNKLGFAPAISETWNGEMLEFTSEEECKLFMIINNISIDGIVFANRNTYVFTKMPMEKSA